MYDTSLKSVTATVGSFVVATAAAWAATTKVIQKGVGIYESDTQKLKIGDGVSTYAQLAYVVQDILSDSEKALLVNAGGAGGVAVLDSNSLVNLAWLPASVKNAPQFVANIAARNALPTPVYSLVVVLDASADTAVGTGTAVYAYNTSTSGYALIAKVDSVDSALAGLRTDVTSLQGSVSTINTEIGSLSSLNTTAKDNLVSAINEVKSATGAGSASVGALSGLNTTNQTTIVGAINEVLGDVTAETARAETAEGVLTTNVGTLSSLTTSVKTNIVAALNSVNAALAAEVTRAEGAESTNATAISTEEGRAVGAEAALQSSINALSTSLSWRPGALCATSSAALAAATNGTALSTLLPFPDDKETPVLSLSDFSVGDFILSKSGASSAIFQVIAAPSTGALEVTQAGVNPLVPGTTFIVQRDLPMPAGQEGISIYTYGSVGGVNELVDLGNFDWSLASGINLSPTFASAVGTVTVGDTVETAISFLVGNLQAYITANNAALAAEIARAEVAEGVLTTNLSNEVTNRGTAIAGVTTALGAETTAREAADATLTTNLATTNTNLGDVTTLAVGVAGVAASSVVAAVNDLSYMLAGTLTISSVDASYWN